MWKLLPKTWPEIVDLNVMRKIFYTTEVYLQIVDNFRALNKDCSLLIR